MGGWRRGGWAAAAPGSGAGGGEDGELLARELLLEGALRPLGPALVGQPLGPRTVTGLRRPVVGEASPDRMSWSGLGEHPWVLFTTGKPSEYASTLQGGRLD